MCIKYGIASPLYSQKKTSLFLYPLALSKVHGYIPDEVKRVMIGIFHCGHSD